MPTEKNHIAQEAAHDDTTGWLLRYFVIGYLTSGEMSEGISCQNASLQREQVGCCCRQCQKLAFSWMFKQEARYCFLLVPHCCATIVWIVLANCGSSRGSRYLFAGTVIFVRISGENLQPEEQLEIVLSANK